MRRALRYTAIWCGATAVAVSVSWFGVRGVLRSDLVDDVPVRPFLAQTVAEGGRTPTAGPTPSPTDSASGTPTPSSAPSPRATPARTRAATPPTRRPTRKPDTPAPGATRGGTPLRVVTVKGGEVVFTLGSGGCRLVSATPATGYTAKVARNVGWIRVDLVKGEHGSGVWCISGEQRTDTWEY
ncbi:hypothetical protein [Nonomuraea lactucae]|uniref:hypothetical protein n=1 Tax=Nonomuraea lactucae TaxID=2249762 RepID=UPI0013B43AF9|nr:hypothetical protein [Nonomuraea lactucae]